MIQGDQRNKIGVLYRNLMVKHEASQSGGVRGYSPWPAWAGLGGAQSAVDYGPNEGRSRPVSSEGSAPNRQSGAWGKRAHICVILCVWIGHLKGLNRARCLTEVNPSAGGALHGRLATVLACAVRARYKGLKWLGHYYIKRASALLHIYKWSKMNWQC
jgi:hypothetical protein